MILASLLAACPSPTDLWVGGDLHRGDAPDVGLGALQEQLGHVGPLVVNLEGPVADLAPPGSAVPLYNPARHLPGLVAEGIRGVGIDNNHTSGADARARTEAAVRAAGLIPLGDAPEADGITLGPGPRIVQLDVSAPDTLTRLSALGTHPHPYDLVVLLHVSGPASYLPTPATRAAVDGALAAGADVVAAHGTHAVGPVERRGGAVIAWGLGNLAFNCACTTETDGILLHVDRDRADVWPIRAGMMGAPTHLAPDPEAVYDLLTAIGSTPLTRHGAFASF